MEKHDWDNRANQLNPEHDAYWQSRGFDGRPADDECDDAQSTSSSWPTFSAPLGPWEDPNDDFATRIRKEFGRGI